MAHNPNIDVPLKGDQIPDFVETAVFKRDVFSETHAGYFAGDPETRIIRRVVSAAPWWSKPPSSISSLQAFIAVAARSIA